MAYKFNFTATDLCLILKTCGEHGVTNLKVGELEVTFKSDVKPCLTESTASSEGAISDIIVEEQKKEAELNLLKEELDLKQSQLEELFITDPEEAENLIASGDLEDIDSDEET